MSCGVYPVDIAGPTCNGQGNCSFDSFFQADVCHCQAGWEGNCDFQVTSSLTDCQINIVAIQVLWALFLAFHLVTFALYVPKLNWLWQKHKTDANVHKINGRRYTLWNNKGLFALLPYLAIGFWCQTVFAISKLVNQNLKLGSSVLMTILYIIWRLTFYFACDVFQPSLLTSILRSQRNLEHIIALNHSLNMLHLGVTWAISITVIIPLVVTVDPLNPFVGVVSIAVFFNITAVAMLVLALQATYVEFKIEAVLQRAYKVSEDKRGQKVILKLREIQTQMRVTGYAQFVIYGIFGCFPYLWNKHDYMLPFAWAAVSLTIGKVIVSLVQEEKTIALSSTKSGGTQEEVLQPATDHLTDHPPLEKVQKQNSTVFSSVVVEVDENAEALLSLSSNWGKGKVTN